MTIARSAMVERVVAVGRETFLETARDRTAAVLVGLASLVIVASVFLAPLALGEGARIVADVGITLASLTGLAVVASAGSTLLMREVERRTLLPVLAGPLRRGEFVVGRALGLFATAVLTIVALCAVHVATLALATGKGWWGILPADLLTVSEMAIMVSGVAFFSAFSTPGLTAALTVAVFIIGHASRDILESAAALPPFGAAVVRGLYGVLPHLDIFNARAAVVHGHAVPALDLAIGVGYSAAYSSALVALACLIFARREIR